MKKYTKTFLIGIFTVFFLNTISVFAEKDIMDVLFLPAKGYEKIINLGDTKNAVGNEVFRETVSVGINEGFGNGCFVNNKLIDEKILENQKEKSGFDGSDRDFCEDVLGGDYDKTILKTDKQAPLIVRITKFLLRITIVLSISFVLYNGLLWTIESAKGENVKNAKNNLIYIVGGVVLSLSSVVIINLISSITVSSINISQGPGCLLNNTFYPKGEILKELVCERVFNGKWKDFEGDDVKFKDKVKGFLNINRCNINGDFKAITDTEQVSKCFELGGTFKN